MTCGIYGYSVKDNSTTKIKLNLVKELKNQIELKYNKETKMN